MRRKLLKAALLAEASTVPKVHDLSLLSSLLSSCDPNWSWDPEALDDLTSGAVASRYPGYSLSSEDATESLAIARALRHALLKRLGLRLAS